MKIAYVSTMNESSWGGSEELWSQAAGIGLAQRHNVLAVVPRFDPLDRRLAAMVAKGLRISTWQPQNLHPLASLLAGGPSWGAWNPLREFEPDVVVVSHGGFMDPTQHPDLLSLLTTWDVPYIVVVQCNTELQLPTDTQRHSHREYFKRAKRVLFVSRRNLETARVQLIDEITNAEVIDNPVNLRDKSPVAWPIESGSVRMACVARLDSYVKGFDVLFQALAGDSWRSRDWTLDIYGKGVNAIYLRELVSWLGLDDKICFAGQVEDVRRIWERSHILVMASRMEGTPLALFEAMWCARTAVVTDVGGNSDLVKDCVTGFLAEAATVSCMKNTLERAWNEKNRWREMGEAARESVSRRDPSPPATLAAIVAQEGVSKAIPIPKAAGERPTVSVVIPCYNYGVHLPQAVESVIAQTYRDIEIIVIDDGSTDDSLAVARSLEWRHADRDFRVFTQANSGQPAIARNNAIRQSRGQFILPLDADDMLAPTCVARMVAVLEADPSVSIVHGDVLCFQDQKVWYQNSGEWDSVEIAAGNRLAYASMYRREVWNKVGGYRTNVIGYEDWDFWIGCAEAGFRGRRIPIPLLYYRHKNDGLLSRAVANDATLRANIVMNHPSMYDTSQRDSARKFLEGTSHVAPDLDTRLRVLDLIDCAEKALLAGDVAEGLAVLQSVDEFSGGDPKILALRRQIESLCGGAAAIKRDLAEADRLWSIGERDHALEVMRKIDETFGARKDVIRALAWMLHELGRSRQAQVQYERLVMLDTNDLSSHELAAANLIADGKTTRAEPYLRKLLSGKPGEPDVLVALARLCASTDRAAEACELYRWLMEDHPSHIYAEEAKKAMASLGCPGVTIREGLGILEQRTLQCAHFGSLDRFFELAGEAIVAAGGNISELPRLGAHLKGLKRSAAIGPSALATQWLGGLDGIEIGGSAHNPFGLRTRNVGMFQPGYVADQLRHCGTWMPVDIHADAARLPLLDESEDFVLSSHVLEHMSDVVGTLLDWFRVVRQGGFLYVVTPLPGASKADLDKLPCPWSHIFDDFLHGAKPEDEPEQGESGGGHYHLLTLDGLENIVAELFGDRCAVVAKQAVDDKVGNGCAIVLRKERALAESFPWIIRDGEDEVEIVLSESAGEVSHLGLPEGLRVRHPLNGANPDFKTRARRLGSWNAGWPKPSKSEPALVVAVLADPRTDSSLPAWFSEGCKIGFSKLSGLGVRFVAPGMGRGFHEAAACARKEAAILGADWLAVLLTPSLPTGRLIDLVRERMCEDFDAIIVGADPVIAVDSRGCPIASGLSASRVDLILAKTDWWDARAGTFEGIRNGPEMACALFRHAKVHPLYRGGYLLGGSTVGEVEWLDPLWQAWLDSTRRMRVPPKDEGHLVIASIANRYPQPVMEFFAVERNNEKALHDQTSHENKLLGKLAEDPRDIETLGKVVEALSHSGRTLEFDIQAKRLALVSRKQGFRGV